MLVQIETARLLLDDSVNAELERRCGFLDDEKMKIFRKRLQWIQKNVTNDWSIFVRGYGL